MKYWRYTLFILMIIAMFTKNINAECDYKSKLEINTSAANVDTKLDYGSKIVGPDGKEHPEATGKTDDIERFVRSTYVTLSIINISDDIYLRIVNEDDDLNETIYASDLVDNKYVYEVPDTDIIRTYTIKVFSNISECLDEEIRTIEVKTPMYNFLSGTSMCENNKAYYCSEFVTTPIDIDTSGILEKENNSESKIEDVVEVKDNKYLIYFILGGVILLTLIILIKNNKEKI